MPFVLAFAVGSWGVCCKLCSGSAGSRCVDRMGCVACPLAGWSLFVMFALNDSTLNLDTSLHYLLFGAFVLFDTIWSACSLSSFQRMAKLSSFPRSLLSVKPGLLAIRWTVLLGKILLVFCVSVPVTIAGVNKVSCEASRHIMMYCAAAQYAITLLTALQFAENAYELRLLRTAGIWASAEDGAAAHC
uniref:Uncharacterized protein n=1 Tax=Alexandrium catenella TaxID=2925 RepID=A0A7S1R2G7_ALECA